MDFVVNTLLFLGLLAVLLALSLAPLLAVVYGVSWILAKREAAAGTLRANATVDD